MLIALTLAAAAPAVPLKPVAIRLDSCTTAACAVEPRRSRYRLDPQVDDAIDTKRTALATDGSACSVVGGRVCTRKPRTIFTTDFTD